MGAVRAVDSLTRNQVILGDLVNTDRLKPRVAPKDPRALLSNSEAQICAQLSLPAEQLSLLRSKAWAPSARRRRYEKRDVMHDVLNLDIYDI